MKYSRMRYEPTAEPLLLALYSFDGTYRTVAFRSDQHMTLALMTGRAEVDCTAIEYGMLPRGAIMVSTAYADDPHAVLAEVQDDTAGTFDPMAAVRLGFSQRILASRSQFIDEVRDAKARQHRPDDARRYELLIDAVERAYRDGGLF